MGLTLPSTANMSTTTSYQPDTQGSPASSSCVLDSGEKGASPCDTPNSSGSPPNLDKPSRRRKQPIRDFKWRVSRRTPALIHVLKESRQYRETLSVKRYPYAPYYVGSILPMWTWQTLRNFLCASTAFPSFASCSIPIQNAWASQVITPSSCSEPNRVTWTRSRRG